MTKTNKRTVASRRRTTVLADNACTNCGTKTEPVTERFRTRVHGEEIEVPDIPYLKCPACGDGLLSLESSAKVSREAKEIYRRKHDLLSPAEIRGMRERFGVSPSRFAALLHIDEPMVGHWEEGRRVQTPLQDVLLRLLRDIPGSYDLLRQRAA